MYTFKAMPRPRSLTDKDVASAALAVIDRDGLTGFTMRAVAAELNMATMSIYRYVEDRERLEELVVELLFSQVDVNPPRRCSWRRQLATLVGRVRDILEAHPQVVPFALGHRLTSADGLRLSENVLTILARAGFTAQQIGVANRTLMAYLLGSVQFEHFGPLSATGAALMATLPQEEYPLLSESAHGAQHMTSDQEFRRGLTIVLDGLEASLKRPSHSRAGST
jgi:AcrR family transcriptional regulator